ncbi:protein SLOW WALKER 2 [Impatiens glandulifera]|uniref:protein SLOW WALKER 2 n=1 Tax=Impatiens glandulifera TaxID=253017 RepID=UPI001FB06664|nr:protein SLOW WALKER 2 [Impatiens glandulifera]
MAKSKSKTPKPTDDEDLLKSDVANFASSLGLASSLPSSGFDDSDFRKTGPLKPNKQPSEKKQAKQQPASKAPEKKEKTEPNSTGVSRVFPVDDSKSFDRFKNLPKLPLAKANTLGVWYVDAAELEEKVLGNDVKNKKAEFKNVQEWKGVVAKKKELAERLLAQYGADFQSSTAKSGDIKMLLKTQRSGTASDKVSAFSVLVGENPIANIRSLDALIGMVTSKVGKRHALTGFEALKELFTSSLLPDRKLKTLFQRPLYNVSDTKDGNSLLLFWYWEECLKERYERFVISIEEASRDLLPILKDKALKTMFVLLSTKPEQERRLLSALVNKLGDPENKAASNADYHLSKLLTDHPNMKAVVVDEVETFMFRPHLGLQAKYHTVNFLSQIRLSHRGDGPKVAKRLIDVYFALFKVLISDANGKETTQKNKQHHKKATNLAKDNHDGSTESHIEMDSRLLSALLTGVNRAFPFVSSDEADDIVELQTPMLFQLVHSKNFNVGVQALMLLDKISSKNQIVSDRFYRALYAKLLLPSTMNSSKAEMFIGLLLRSMKNDINLKRVSAFSKRLLQVALQQPPQYACGCLFLLSEVLKARPSLWQMLQQSESVDDDTEHFVDFDDENEKQQVDDKSTKEVVQVDNVITQVLRVPENDDSDSDDDDDDDDDDEDVVGSESDSDDASDDDDDFVVGDSLKDKKEKPMSVSNLNIEQPTLAVKSTLPGGYDPKHREPSYSNADHVSWWELTVLASHVHPSVSTMARTLISGANIVYNGNPLNDLSLPSFLDKLMEKKAKRNAWHGGSEIEPAKKLDMSHQLIGSEILSLGDEDIPPEDLVFHKFYMNKMKSSKKPKKKKKKSADEDDDGDLLGGDVSGDEEIEDMLDGREPGSEEAAEYDYSDLDEVADEEDELIGDGSDDDVDMDIPSDMGEDNDDESSKMDEEVEIGDEDENGDGKKRKQKIKGKSPFASIEDYEHLLDEDVEDEGIEKKKFKSRKKSKKSH